MRIVDLAIEREADALTIGGDLYESERAGPETARFLFDEFARYGKPVFVAPGNHDPHAPNALLARSDLPENVRIFNEAAWLAYPLAEHVTLYGFGHTPAEPGRPFAGVRFDRPGARIALVHGSDEARCPPKKRATAPFSEDEVAASGATLLLSGHYHGGYVARRDGRPLIAYPGSPEPIKFGEATTHGALVVEVRSSAERPAIDIEAVPIARTRLLERRCDLAGAGTEREVEAALAAAVRGAGPSDYLRVTLEGAVAAQTRVDRAALTERFERGLGSLEVVDRSTPYDYAAIAREPTVRGHVVRDLLARREAASGDDARRADAALRFALAAFDGAEPAP